MIPNTFPVESVRFVRPDVAIVHLSGFRVNVDKSEDFARATVVFVKNGGRWEIEAFQNTPILNPPVSPKTKAAKQRPRMQFAMCTPLLPE